MKLLIVWKSDSYQDIDYFMLPYAINSKKKGWFEEVTVLIWGASAHYAKVYCKKHIEELIENNVNVLACKYCADQCRVTKKLETWGVEVFYAGEYLSEKMKDPEYKVITI